MQTPKQQRATRFNNVLRQLKNFEGIHGMLNRIPELKDKAAKDMADQIKSRVEILEKLVRDCQIQLIKQGD